MSKKLLKSIETTPLGLCGDILSKVLFGREEMNVNVDEQVSSIGAGSISSSGCNKLVSVVRCVEGLLIFTMLIAVLSHYE
jgi:hypothetical protein